MTIKCRGCDTPWDASSSWTLSPAGYCYACEDQIGEMMSAYDRMRDDETERERDEVGD